MRLLVLSLFFSSFLFAGQLQLPSKHYTADGAVTEILIDKDKLYSATAVGVVNIFDIKTTKKIKTITIPQIKDFLGDKINPKIFSIDLFDNSLLLLSQAQRGYRELFLYNRQGLRKIISTQDKLSIAKAKFIDENTLILGLLSNDIISYNIKEHKRNWMVQASQSKFSDFALNEDKSKVVISDESGELHILNTKDGTLFKLLNGQNLDNVFQVAFKNSVVVSAGQDRRCGVYNIQNKKLTAYYKKSHFLVYGVALSPSAKKAAYSSDEENNIIVFNTSTRSKLAHLGGNKMTIVKMLFQTQNRLFVASDDRVINFYILK